jgi:hypothetical protein
MDSEYFYILQATARERAKEARAEAIRSALGASRRAGGALRARLGRAWLQLANRLVADRPPRATKTGAPCPSSGSGRS